MDFFLKFCSWKLAKTLEIARFGHRDYGIFLASKNLNAYFSTFWDCCCLWLWFRSKHFPHFSSWNSNSTMVKLHYGLPFYISVFCCIWCPFNMNEYSEKFVCRRLKHLCLFKSPEILEKVQRVFGQFSQVGDSLRFWKEAEHRMTLSSDWLWIKKKHSICISSNSPQIESSVSRFERFCLQSPTFQWYFTLLQIRNPPWLSSFDLNGRLKSTCIGVEKENCLTGCKDCGRRPKCFTFTWIRIRNKKKEKIMKRLMNNQNKINAKQCGKIIRVATRY